MPFCAVTEEAIRGSKHELALAVAGGAVIADWARRWNVPMRTAYRWSNGRKFRKFVQRTRREWIDAAVGKMSMRAPSTVDKLAVLADTTDSDSVKLRALRGELADMMAVSRYSDLEVRMTEIEVTLEGRRTGQLEGPGG
jgi:hypothetical protein